MTEQFDAHSELSAAGVLDGFRWSHRTAYATVLNDYNPDTGHDQGWVGYTGYKLMCDRLDRVFSCKKFAVKSESEASAGLDVLALGLPDSNDIKNMPRLAPGSVTRFNIHGSPGWRVGRWTFITASFPYGGIDNIAWKNKSKTKRRIASQPDPDQLMLPFEELGLEEAVELVRQAIAPDGPILILAHSVDTFTGQGELFVGRSSLNPKGENPWIWKEDLLKETGGPDGLRRIEPQMPTGPTANKVEDANVRLRRADAEDGNSSTIG